MKELEKFVEIVRRLRDKEHGCPWDCAQNLMTLRRFLVEESGEYLDAVEADDNNGILEELGDLLLQVVLNAQVASDEGRFTLEDVAAAESAKMIRRHPHVFGNAQLNTEEELRASWEQVKKEEKGAAASAIDGIPRHLPALMRAQKISHKAAQANFDWGSDDDAFSKISEELTEVKKAYKRHDEANLKEELGDLLFAIVVFCRFQKFQAEELLQASISKFAKRFHYVESHLDLQTASLEQMVSAWKEAKMATKTTNGDSTNDQ
ncbi:MAG: nucleoside triphosphate pyrophosphohydrolase [Victivallales bacterium]|nr:nucleoside triphosphate pyrophosphohydrolase [Victivallales bacterium]